MLLKHHPKSLKSGLMTYYSRTKDQAEHLAAIEDFEKNMPKNRGTWKPPEGYELAQHQYHRSGKRRRNHDGRQHRRNDNAPAPRIDSTIRERGKTFKVVAKARTQWSDHDVWKNGQYNVYTHMLLFKVSDA